MLYGEPATVAVAVAPALARVTLLAVSPLTRPLLANSVPVKVTVWPYVLLVLSAVTVKALALTVSLPLARVALPTLSPLTRPLLLNSVPAKVTVCPYVLLALLAVTASALALSLRDALPILMV